MALRDPPRPWENPIRMSKPDLILLLAASMALPAAADDFTSEISPLIQKYCIECHGGEDVKAGIDFNDFKDYNDVLRHREVWDEVYDQVDFQDMPPEDEKQPTDAERKKITDWLHKNVVNADWAKLADPGRVSLSRLTRLEYNNSLRDLFGMDLQSGIYLGRDPEGSTGFTNDRGNLTFPLFALQDFLREAERATDAVFSYSQPAWTGKFDMADEWKLSSDRSVGLGNDKKGVSLGNPKKPFHFGANLPHDGLYELTISARTIGNEPIGALQVFIAGRPLEPFLIEGRENKDYKLIVNAASGFNAVTLASQPDATPLIQPRFDPAPVPKSLEKQAAKGKVPEFLLPEKFASVPGAKRRAIQFNKGIKAYYREAQLSEFLLARGETDYDGNSYLNFTTAESAYDHQGKRIAFIMGLTNDQLRYLLRDEFGFDLDKIIDSNQAYRKAYEKSHPDRRYLQAGTIQVDNVTISNHPASRVGRTAESILAAPQTEAGVRGVLASLAAKAWRRPAEDAQLQPMVDIYKQTLDETGSHVEGLRDAIVGLLVSPRFLLNFSGSAEDKLASIDDYDFATRLAFFFWMSSPDESLQKLATQGILRDPANTSDLLDLLVKDPRFEDFCQAFTEQWLNLGVIEGPSQPVIDAMRKEPALLLAEIIRENRSILDLLDAKETFVNSILADHYDLPPVEGNGMRKVELADNRRGGLTTMGAMLAATSPPGRTSPVARGAWVVENILGIELPPPPPSVPELKVDNTKRTVREELELHRTAKGCSGCHKKIDPYGFVFENFDPKGRWRDTENGLPIDASAETEDGVKFNGVVEFKSYLREKRSDDFARNLTTRLLEFALGREMQYYDEAMIRRILVEMKADGYHARSLLAAIIRTEAFQKQNNTADK